MEAITTWDLTDGKWLGAPSGVLTVDAEEKPAFKALMKLIHGDWETHESLKADDNGIVTLTGFKGEYELNIDGKTVKVTLDKDSEDIIPVVI